MTQILVHLNLHDDKAQNLFPSGFHMLWLPWKQPLLLLNYNQSVVGQDTYLRQNEEYIKNTFHGYLIKKLYQYKVLFIPIYL